MKYYPVSLDIRHRNCLVVGGGSVGTRKVKTLLECGASVTVVSPAVSAEIQSFAKTGRVEWRSRGFKPSDLSDMFLVIGATDNEVLNNRIHSHAEERNMLCNIADRPAACNFILPAVVVRGDLQIAISTSGNSPAFAKHVKRRLEKEFGEEYQAFLSLMGAIRRKLLSEAHEPEAHKSVFEKLIAGNLPELIRKKEMDHINQLLYEILGPGYRFESLTPNNRREA